MPRITCRVPATARPIPIRGTLPLTGFETIAEAPDFSVPDANENFDTRDPNDSRRAIRPGEIFFLTPVKVRNRSSITLYVEAQILGEDGSETLLERVAIPPGDSAVLVAQGLSLLKRDPDSSNGDRMQVRVLNAESSNDADISGAAQEQPSNEHIGVVNG